MTYFPKTKIESSDSPSVDAFGRWRVGNPSTIFSSKQLQNSGVPLYWAEKLLVGASSSFERPRASTFLYVSGTTGSRAIKQTKQRFYYQPGKSLSIIETFNLFGNQSGILKRTGYFDESDGIFFELSGSQTNMVIRSSVSGTPVENRVSQSAWNIDPLDGSGPSGLTLNTSKVQIFEIDFQWLGVGRVRTGFNINGMAVPVHEFLHANIENSVYMSTPNLPVRYEIENSNGGSSAVIEQICSSVVSEGGVDLREIGFSIDRGTTGLLTSTGKVVPVLSIKTTSGSQTTVIPDSVGIMTNSSVDFRWGLYLNPTFGLDNASWQSTSSSLEYDISRNQNNILSGGYLLRSGYVDSSAKKSTANIATNFSTGFSIGKDVDGVSDEIVLAVELISTGSATFYASFGYTEHE